MSQKVNQFGDAEDVSNMSVQDWDKRWGLGQTQFHMPKVHPMLEKHYNLLVEGGGKKRIYLPLCGKSVDLKWLASQGHSVVGSEGADLGCQQFFQENDIEFKVTKLPNIDGALFEATNGLDIKIYRCDFFQLKNDTLGEFDCIWDRGSFVAIPLQRRREYADLIVPCLKKDGQYLLDCFLLDNSMFAGPPFNCTEENVKEIFEGKCTVRKLDERDAITKWQQEGWGIKSFIEQVHLLTRLQ